MEINQENPVQSLLSLYLSLSEKLNSLPWYWKKLQHLCEKSWNMAKFSIFCCYRYILLRINPFFIHFLYLLCLSFLGFGMLKSLNPRSPNFTPRNIDLFFTSVSLVTISSMSTVEMEAFSNSQLIAMAALMFVSGEVFTSMAGLHLQTSRIPQTRGHEWGGIVDSFETDLSPPPPPSSWGEIELGSLTGPDSGPARPGPTHRENPFIDHDSIKFLGLVVSGYLLAFHVIWFLSVLAYLSLVRSTPGILRKKGLEISTFAVFTVVSSFASCGFIPTNENMMVFAKNSGLLLILIPIIFFGNSMFPLGLRLLLWALHKGFDRAEARYLLRNANEARYPHLLSWARAVSLAGTVLGLVLFGFALFCAMEWDSASLSGLGGLEKVVGIFFVCVNARHAGETIVDLSTVGPAILAFFVIMMYIQPYTSFVPTIDMRDGEIEAESKLDTKDRKKTTFAQNLALSNLSYLAIFVVVICITERKGLEEDSRNFNVLNIIVEATSAYGNVGFTTGYSCERQIRPDPNCQNKWYGFCGKWSDEGKVVIIILMVFGRLKNFNRKGGRAWKLLL